MRTPEHVMLEEERRAEEVYERVIRPKVRPEDDGKYVAVAFEHDDFEIDRDDYTAMRKVLDRHPGARLFLMRTGPSPAYYFAGSGV
jgi:hypothetical protein